MTTKYYVVEILDKGHGISSFFDEFQGDSYEDVLSKAKNQYPNSEMFNVYIHTNHVNVLEGGYKPD